MLITASAKRSGPKLISTSLEILLNLAAILPTRPVSGADLFIQPRYSLPFLNIFISPPSPPPNERDRPEQRRARRDAEPVGGTQPLLESFSSSLWHSSATHPTSLLRNREASGHRWSPIGGKSRGCRRFQLQGLECWMVAPHWRWHGERSNAQNATASLGFLFPVSCLLLLVFVSSCRRVVA